MPPRDIQSEKFPPQCNSRSYTSRDPAFVYVFPFPYFSSLKLDDSWGIYWLAPEHPHRPNQYVGPLFNVFGSQTAPPSSSLQLNVTASPPPSNSQFGPPEQFTWKMVNGDNTISRHLNLFWYWQTDTDRGLSPTGLGKTVSPTAINFFAQKRRPLIRYSSEASRPRFFALWLLPISSAVPESSS